MDWSVTQIEELRQLWSEGLSTIAIGLRMGISKNSVVGKSHRLGLEARQSPIKRSTLAPDQTTDEPTSVPKPRVVVVKEPWKTVFTRSVAIVRKAPAVVPVPLVVKPAFVPQPKPTYIPRTHSCTWPTGHSPNIKFLCTEPAILGKPFCEAHSARAYVKTQRQEDANV